MARFENAFRNPGKDYRAAPFWSWNDRLTDEELTWQIDEMKAAGMGGFFMHSRPGLITPFLSEEWMARVKTCVEYAAQVGMNAWAYDEDRWPSGTAGALVTEPHPEFQMRPLVEVELAPGEPLPTDGDLVAVFAAGKGVRPRDVTADPAAAQDGRRFVFYVPAPRPRTWFNGTGYLDTMNPEAVRCFIETAYAAYEPVVGDQFGQVVPGIFTDEPNYLNFPTRPGERAVPWTPGFAAFFRRRRGYDLLPALPAVFHRVGRWRQVRHDYWLTATERFVESYARQIGRWCGRHRLMMTGHMLAEESLASQVSRVGAAMPHYEHMQAPGVDILRERIAETLTLKQCSSVAHQVGRKWVLSELYGVTGWQFTFEGMKWMGDWHAVLGVNVRCPHLTLYSLRGCRKRDYPPSFNYQSPWWGDYRLVADYFARVNLAMTEGTFAADILLLHPISGAWCLYEPGNTGAVDRLSRTFKRLSESLLGLHRDHDYGDESILARRAKVSVVPPLPSRERARMRVRDIQAKGPGAVLKVGRMTYRAVVVPPMPSIEPKTLALLTELAAAGGTVIAVEPTPTRLAGVPSDEIKTFFAAKGVTRVRNSATALARALDRALPRRISVANDRGREVSAIWVHERQVRSKHVFFLANTDRRKGYEATIRLPLVGKVEVLDAETGGIAPLPVSVRRNGVQFKHTFAPAGSLLVRVDPACEPVRAHARLSKPAAVRRVALAGPWALKRNGPNALTLDTCRYRIRAGRWSRPVPVWRASEAIIERFGLVSNRTNDSVQYWRLYPKAKRLGKDARIALRFEFRVNSVPDEPISLVLEAAERFDISLNGRPIDHTPVGWYVDKAFQVVELGDAVRRGDNVLELAAVMSQDLELEACYLIGSFAVSRRTRAIRAREPRMLRPGDWCDQGYPYYTGTMTYKGTVHLPAADGRRAVLELGEFSAALTRVCVNGAPMGARGWPPFRWDIAGAIQGGFNDIEIDLVATNRNLLGPHHFKAEAPAWAGPPQFSDEDHWTDAYLLHPYGLMTPPRITLA